ncbi:MAG: dihydroneopterin aldolase [Verrucomicrobiales bacterium]|jgi:dihydroneopterin aldolase
MTIRLNGIRVETHVGVPAEERAHPQTLKIDLCLSSTQPFDRLDDDITKTIDYHAVWTRVHEIATNRPRKLIETLADDLAQQLLADFPLIAEISVVIHKFILPETDSVSVSTTRRREKTEID